MAEFGTSRGLHNGSLTATTIGAAPGGPFPVRNAAPIVVPMARHGYTLHYLISIITHSRQRSPSQHKE